MIVEFQKDPSSADRWLIVEEGQLQVGAYMPAFDDQADLTVFWRGLVGVKDLHKIVQAAEGALTKMKGDLQGTLIAYGSSRESLGPSSNVSAYLETPSKFTGFGAFRAELRAYAGKVVLWANVTDADQVNDKASSDLKDGGENIGLSVSPELFDGPVRPVIAAAIAQTKRVESGAVTSVLQQVSRAMLDRGVALA